MKSIDRHGIYCSQPATRWEDALPTGNGSIGALVYGNICRDTVIINHEALWIKGVKDDPPDVSGCLPEIREMLENEEWSFLDNYWTVMLAEKGYSGRQSDPYHPAFELVLETEPSLPFTDYRRSVDFTTGVAEVEWKEGSTHHTRKYFVSRDSDAICIHVSATVPVSYVITLQERGLVEENHHKKETLLKWRDIPITFKKAIHSGDLSITGTYTSVEMQDLQFGGVCRVVSDGERITRQPDQISIRDAMSITIIIKVFHHCNATDRIPALQEEIDAMPRSFQALLENHLSKYTAFYERLDFHVESTSQTVHQEPTISNEQLLLDAYGGSVPHALVERMFHLGRYLLIASSKPGGWPANLQGVWNGYYLPAWNSDYHNDENIQMNYWAALPGNLQEATLPYFEYYEAGIPSYRRLAQRIYGCRGIFMPIAQSIKGDAPLYAGPWLNWTAGAGWIGQLFYDYYLFTLDKEFLRNHAIPFLKEVALFYEDFLIIGDDGYYKFSPSLSPENAPSLKGAGLVTVNATMDVAVAKEVLSNLVDGCMILGIENGNVSRWKEMLRKLPPYQVNEDGAIKEWIHPRLPDNYHHRHLSHIYGLFPGLEITEEFTPELYAACEVAVMKRQVIGQASQSGWSLAHMANIYARLGQGDRALACLENLIRSAVGPNLFTYHNDWRHMGLSLYWDFIDRLFQIDANFGLTAAILEMLVFSNKNIIKVLPALPARWTKGYLKGAACRGGFTLNISWDLPEREMTLMLTRKSDEAKNWITMKFPCPVSAVEHDPGAVEIHDSPLGRSYREIEFKSGRSALLEVKLE